MTMNWKSKHVERFDAVLRNINYSWLSALALGYIEQNQTWTIILHLVFWPSLFFAAVSIALWLAGILAEA